MIWLGLFIGWWLGLGFAFLFQGPATGWRIQLLTEDGWVTDAEYPTWWRTFITWRLLRADKNFPDYQQYRSRIVREVP